MKNKRFLFCLASFLFFAEASLNVAYAEPEFYSPWKCGTVQQVTEGNCCNDTSKCSHTCSPMNAETAYAYDIDMASGTAFYAPVDGTITEIVEINACVDCGSKYNNYIWIQMDSGEYVQFLHHRNISAAIAGQMVGNKVKRGDLLGYAGSVGDSKIAHLHFSFWDSSRTKTIPAKWVGVTKEQACYGKTSCNIDIVSNNCSNVEICDNKDNNNDGQIDEDSICSSEYSYAYLMSGLFDRHSTDIDGDGKAEICIIKDSSLRCVFPSDDDFSNDVEVLKNDDSNSHWDSSKAFTTLRFADINGDKKADVCMRVDAGIKCWPSEGRKFGRPIVTNLMPFGDDNDVTFLTIRFADVNGDGKDDFCAIFSNDEVACYLSNGNGFDKKVSVAHIKGVYSDPAYYTTLRFADINGDGKADVCIKDYDKYACRLSNGESFGSDEEVIEVDDWSHYIVGYYKPRYYLTVRTPDTNGDGKADICIRNSGMSYFALSEGTKFQNIFRGPDFSDLKGWSRPEYYSTIMTPDINGDGKDDICYHSFEAGMICYLSIGSKFDLDNKLTIDDFRDADGWNVANAYRTIQAGDINGDGRADICGRNKNGVLCYSFNGSEFVKIVGPEWSDEKGFGTESSYSTFRVAGISGTPCTQREEICGDNIDNNCNGLTDCQDDACKSLESCQNVSSSEICDDNIDNDGDDKIDCKDEDCVNDPACKSETSSEICDDNIDNDGDDKVDCKDEDCANDPACKSETSSEICDDNIDNDGDDKVDCKDEDCANDPACKSETSSEICDDNIDNDGDDKVDCKDEDCANDPACKSDKPSNSADQNDICEGEDCAQDDGKDESRKSSDSGACDISSRSGMPSLPATLLAILAIATGFGIRRRRKGF